MAVAPERTRLWFCAYVLQDWKLRTGLLVRKAYRDDTSDDERRLLLREIEIRFRNLARAARSERLRVSDDTTTS